VNAPIWHTHGAFWGDREAICSAFAPVYCDLPANLLMIRGLWHRSRSRSTTATALTSARALASRMVVQFRFPRQNENGASFELDSAVRKLKR
jgi:hypothetical protein